MNLSAALAKARHARAVERRAYAIHEAGHVVADDVLGQPLPTRVTVHPAGGSTCSPGPRLFDSDRDRFAACVSLAAGYAASRLVAGVPEDRARAEAAADFAQLRRFAAAMVGAGNEATVEAEALREAEALVRANGKAIERFARVLDGAGMIEGGRRVEAVLRWAKGEAPPPKEFVGLTLRP
ncbi:MAG TPA: hypothetical protein VNO86_05095 [Candidatus Binatia bacterium]|nr:hypothetical protein [Candidatus Binatia bacterium]